VSVLKYLVEKLANTHKQRFGVYLPSDLIERVRNTVYWTPGITLSDLVGKALTAYIDKLDEERGEPLPPRKGNVKTGRLPTK
jgi:hypothetical protein